MHPGAVEQTLALDALPRCFLCTVNERAAEALRWAQVASSERVMSAPEFKKILLVRMQAALKPAGFRTRGNTFSSEQNDVVVFIQLQSSSKSARDRLIATVTLGVFSRSVATKVGNTRKPNILAAHWRKRLGFLLPEPHDKWWEVQSHEQAHEAGVEIAESLLSYALPELQGIASTVGLKTLWESGKSPGLTEYQRKQYLRVLNL